MITADEAKQTASQALRQLEADSGRPLAMFDGQFGLSGVEDHGDVWVINWNSVEFLESGDPMIQVLSGPIVVPKDGSDWLVLGTYGTTDEMLTDWRAATE